MVVERELQAVASGVEFRLEPNRSSSRRGLIAFFLVLSSWSLAVAAASAAQGNVFAPFFALFELTAVALCLALVFRGMSRQETVRVGRDGVVVAGTGHAGEVRFDTYWVRLWRESDANGAGRRRLLLASHGRTVEVGSFLADDERQQLERQLRRAIDAQRGSGPSRTDKAG
jgi:uncharacterized membrane protein